MKPDNFLVTVITLCRLPKRFRDLRIANTVGQKLNRDRACQNTFRSGTADLEGLSCVIPVHSGLIVLHGHTKNAKYSRRKAEYQFEELCRGLLLSSALLNYARGLKSGYSESSV